MSLFKGRYIVSNQIVRKEYNDTIHNRLTEPKKDDLVSFPQNSSKANGTPFSTNGKLKTP